VSIGASDSSAQPARAASPIILITGADGQVGWEAHRAFQPLGKVVALRRADVDLANHTALRAAVRAIRPAIIVNAAAFTEVDRAESARTDAFAVNAVAPRALAEEAERIGAILVHFSTDYVFDGTKPSPYTEADDVAPLSVYGESKLEGDRAVLASGTPHLVFRTGWVYAARGRNFMLTMLRLAHERELLRVVSDQVGAPTPARLLASASAHILARHSVDDGFSLPESHWGVYNLTARGATSWYEFARQIVSLDPRRETQRCREITPIATAEYPTAARRPASSLLDVGKLERTFQLRMPEWSTQVPLVMDELGSS
jgi:dTDP-4-dehydrorhamnose reductase